jgi:hypothetical protein
MGNVQNCNGCINTPSLQTYTDISNKPQNVVSALSAAEYENGHLLCKVMDALFVGLEHTQDFVKLLCKKKVQTEKGTIFLNTV